MLDISHPVESSLPDDRRSNFQAAWDESILIEKNDDALTVLICEYVLSYNIPNPAAIHPRTVLENYCLHKIINCICKSVPTSLISLNLIIYFGTRLWKRNEYCRVKKKGTEHFSG
ncbi:uncharacterized protein BO88DRAFT_429985 [Aspergillus vadensis CBS 113365]|uniref:Uncharacterized protein n=1 Tax=Aspergillus vadensis (strain CBS 113365 / IMI 142717 / IBT 24658) TaxID=1448311 RepID=A0A319B190_ASPVC|nr:hypothetical protein BO88DRAFT_429985 [Aspergillus vadensis CBS 113365]PYH63970.1 hypothetical protein BO88DRAFT_429985 [Aspergillus vadensis CBS 113365]